MTEQNRLPAGVPPKDIPHFVDQAEPYTLGPDSLPKPGVPQGEVTKFQCVSERHYPGTIRDYWVYVPQQYTPANAACLMVFLDGPMYLGSDVSAPTVFDNLIHAGEMPVTIGVFVNPGDKGPGMPIFGGDDNRSVEYDSLGDTYARFLLEEILMGIEKRYHITRDPASRAICGISSGGICAFNAAWHRPDAFGKVVSHCGSFADVRGGHNLPSMVRRVERKPLRVFLQSGANDLDVIFGNWPLANQEMASALAYREYDYQFVFGEGRHTLKHGGAIFPDTLRWLWSESPR